MSPTETSGYTYDEAVERYKQFSDQMLIREALYAILHHVNHLQVLPDIEDEALCFVLFARNIDEETADNTSKPATIQELRGIIRGA